MAKERGVVVNGYVDTIVKGYKNEVISEELCHKLKPFLDFRNSLIHRYWMIDDTLLIQNLQERFRDFSPFIEEIEAYLKHRQALEMAANENRLDGEKR